MQDDRCSDELQADRHRPALSLFLADRRRRPSLQPTADELSRRPYRRKAPAGLRSTEVAIRAGIDPGYYAKLEQGRAASPSPDVLDAIARALELNDAEAGHLFALTRRGHRAASGSTAHKVLPPGGRELLDGLPTAPAYIMDRAYDLLGWNDGVSAVFGDPGQLPPPKRNVVWMMFGGPAMREAIEDWTGHAQRLLAQFRLDWGESRGDARFEELVIDLLDISPEFSSWWPRHDVQGRQLLSKRVLPPGFDGPIEFTQTTWALSTAPGVRLVAYVPIGPDNLHAVADCIGRYRGSVAPTP